MIPAEVIYNLPEVEPDHGNAIAAYAYHKKDRVTPNFKFLRNRRECKAKLRLLKPGQPNGQPEYPTRYVQDWTLNDGSKITFRPIRPDDVPLMVKFHEGLSQESVYFRWFSPLGLSQRIDPARLERVCRVDYLNEFALVAEGQDDTTGEPKILGVGRLTRVKDTNEVELSIIICDGCQRLGLGTELINRLIKVGHDLKFERIVGDVHPENRKMQKICRKLGFEVCYSLEEEVTKIGRELQPRAVSNYKFLLNNKISLNLL